MADIEIDQSGRIEVMTVITVLAFSDGIRSAALIPAPVKRTVSQKPRARGIKPKMISIRMFVAGMFLLLHDHLKGIERITIDTEFPGRDAEIRGLLLAHIRRRHSEFESEQIAFHQIGKGAAAHHVAWLTYRGERIAERRISAEELLRYC